MRLIEWRKKEKKSQVWLAIKLGISQQALDKIEREGLRGAKRINQIERATDGAVRAKDLLRIEERK
jgi:DNA-binding XRE family transcriptional regulator